MDIFIVYVIKTLLLPVSSLLFLGITGVFLLKQRGFAMALICFSFASLIILSLPVVAKYLASTQEKYLPLKMVSLKDITADAIVVLGGGLNDGALEYPQQITLSTNTLARIRYAAVLTKKINLPLLVSGGKVFKSNSISEAEIMAEVLKNEFNQTVRWREQKSRNTAENAIYTHKILNEEGIRHIILITHALHMHRAIQQFQQQGFQVIPAPTNYLSTTKTLNLLSFLPSAKALEHSSLVMHEIMGNIWYALRY